MQPSSDGVLDERSIALSGAVVMFGHFGGWASLGLASGVFVGVVLFLVALTELGRGAARVVALALLVPAALIQFGAGVIGLVATASPMALAPWLKCALYVHLGVVLARHPLDAIDRRRAAARTE